jgi:hypothetical protein
MPMTDQDRARLAAIVEATTSVGGYVAVGGPEATELGDYRIEWWHPGLVMAAWTTERHDTLGAALAEASRRLEVEPTP